MKVMEGSLSTWMFFFKGGGSEEICFLLGDDVFFPETHSGFLGIFPDLSLPCTSRTGPSFEPSRKSLQTNQRWKCLNKNQFSRPTQA